MRALFGVAVALLSVCAQALSRWPTNPDAGLQVSTPGDHAEELTLTTAADGGVWVAFASRPAVGPPWAPYVQGFDLDGVPLFGTPLNLGGGSDPSLMYHALASAPAPGGGFWLSWDSWQSNNDLRVQYFNSAGAAQWPPTAGLSVDAMASTCSRLDLQLK